MADIHPLVKMVEQVLSAQPQNATYADLSRAAIRAVLTFEPNENMLEERAISSTYHAADNTYRAMTATLLKEVEDGR